MSTEIYRVITLWQPWATLLVHGIKKIETRPAPTSWTHKKGVYLIHAASKWTKEQERICLSEPFLSELEKLNYAFYDKVNLPLGKIIGAVEVDFCKMIFNEDGVSPYYFDYFNFKASRNYISEPEKSFGDYKNGRCAWLCQNPRVLKEPIPYKGGQGYYQKLKGVDDSLIQFL